MKATTKEDFRTGQYAPAIEKDDGSVITYSPTSFSEERAMELVEKILTQTLLP